MKKGFILLVLAIVIPACVFAGSGVFNFSVGATAAYQGATLGEVVDGGVSAVSIKDFKFGADLDAKVLFFDINAKCYYQPNDDKGIINGIVSANLAVDLVIVRLKAGLGYEYGYTIGEEDSFRLGNNAKGETKGWNKDLKEANLDVYAGVDVLLGDLVIGVYGTLPTSTSIGNGDWAGLFSSIKDNWKAASIGLSVGYSII